jgi:hypothetical protein
MREVPDFTLTGACHDQLLAGWPTTADTTLRPMRKRARTPKAPFCYVCVKDGIYERTALPPRATVRIGICREPYAINVCEGHLVQLEHALPKGGVWVLKRYTELTAPGLEAQ